MNHDSGFDTPGESANIDPINRVEPINVIIPTDNIIFIVDRTDGETGLSEDSVDSNQLFLNE